MASRIHGASETSDVIVNVSGVVAFPVQLTIGYMDERCEGVSSCESYSFDVTINNEDELPLTVPGAGHCYDTGEESSFLSLNFEVSGVDACGNVLPPSSGSGRITCCRNGGRFGCPE